MLSATPDAEPQPEPDRELEAELASFTLLGKDSVSAELPGQLDLTDLTSEGHR